MADPLRLMCVLAHPNDESLGTGGILAKYAAEGVETFGHLTYYRAFSVVNGRRRVEIDLFDGLR